MRGVAYRVVSSFVVILCSSILASQLMQCHRVAEKASASSAPVMNLDELGYRVLIVSPHPDDEVLACGGLIALLSRNGASVNVVFVTLGEGFTFALEQELRTILVSKEDRLRFARLRSEEAKRALATLGGNARTIFLGIPETAMSQMWLRHWGKFNPCKTNAIRSAYSYPLSDGIKPISLCIDDAIDQLKRLIHDFKPTSIFIPHRHDDHIVHWVTNILSLAAIVELRCNGNLPNDIPVYEYLVHFGRYPTPQGNFPKLPLLPPKALFESEDEKWLTLPLPQDVVELKAKAIKAYESQRSVMPRFMSSFIRSTEIFERADLSEHAESPILICDRPFEPVMPAIHASADIKGAIIAHMGDVINATLSLRSTPSEQITYRMHLFKPACADEIRHHVVISANGDGTRLETIGVAPSLVNFQRVGKDLFFSFPKHALMGFETWLCTFEVVAFGKMVDRTAPVIVNLKDEPLKTRLLPSQLRSP